MKGLRLKNIKSFVDSGEVEYKPLTIFVGPNSSGKSSLLRFPAVLHQTFKEDVYAPLLLFGRTLDYGNFSDVVHNHNGNKINFEIKLNKKKLERYLRFSRSPQSSDNRILKRSIESVSIDVELEKKDKRFFVSNYKLTLNDKYYFEVKNIQGTDHKFKTNIEVLKNEINFRKEIYEINLKFMFDRFIPDINLMRSDIIDLIIQKDHNLQITKDELSDLKDFINENVRPQRNESDIINQIKNNKYSDLITDVYNKLNLINIFDDFNISILRSLAGFTRSIKYVGPFRQNPQRTYRNIESNFQDVGINGENTMSLLRQDKELEGTLLEKVSKWTQNAVGHKIEINEIKNSNFFQLMVTNKNSNDNLIDVGFGISQVLPIITQIYHKQRNTLNDGRRYFSERNSQFIIIEQPELHLHPAAQTALADLFVERVIENEKRDIICIETHSEHLIRKLQVLVADPEININCNDIAIYYVDKTNESKGSITTLRIDETGQFIDKWPSGFFDRSYGLTMDLMKANQRRNKNEF